MEINKAIDKVIDFRDLSEDEARLAFDDIMSGRAAPSQISALIVGLRMKGETVDEITGAVSVMREKSLKIKVDTASPVVDTCGTGGSGAGVFNISTVSAFVAAGCGIRVAKHGNRAASSKCGSADVLEKLGVKLDVPIEVTEKCVNTINIGFLFAPLFHGAMKHAAAVRKEIGARTIFNILGPLSNPASATSQVLGVYDEKLTETMANVLKKLGTKRAYVVHGIGKPPCPLDEVTISGKTIISELKDGAISSYYVSPETFGLKEAKIDDIKGGTPEENAGIIRSVLSGEKGPKRDVVLMNAALALMAADAAETFKESAQLAAVCIDSGKALDKLERLIEETNKG